MIGMGESGGKGMDLDFGAGRCKPLHLEWINKMWYIYKYTGILFSHEKYKIMPFAATWMDLESIILSEVSQTKTDII